MITGKHKYDYDAETFPNFHSYTFLNIKTGETHYFEIFADRQDDKHSTNDLQALIMFVEQNADWLIGYNNKAYDDLLLVYLLMHKKRLLRAHPKQITKEIKNLSDILISAQHGRKSPPEAYTLKQYEKPFKSLDLLLLYNTAERTGLKQLAIGLRWHWIEDLPFSPDHIVLRDERQMIKEYNLNDVHITGKVREKQAKNINLRIDYTRKYGVNIINSCKSEIGKKLICHYYSEVTGIPQKDFYNLRTFYDRIHLKDVVNPKIQFRTPEYNRVLKIINESSVDPNKKQDLNNKSKRAKIFGASLRTKYVTHTIGLGGIHSENQPEIIKQNAKFAYIDLDATSFYPFIKINGRLYPKHLGPAYIEVYEKYIVNERVRMKKIDKNAAEILKIAANAPFGMTNSVYSPFYDPMLTYTITINGQLFLMMLMEALEMQSDCIVVYSNTDGLTIRVPREQIPLFYKICSRWEKYVGFELEYNYYQRMILRDVNNYMMFVETTDPEKYLKAKGDYAHEKEEFKGYNYPIIAKAVQSFFEEGCPVDETIMMERSVYEFMKSEKTSQAKFDVVIQNKAGITKRLQKHNRWIVTHGNKEEGKIYRISKETILPSGKKKPAGLKTEMESGHYVTCLNRVDEAMPIENYKIEYDYYINEARKMTLQTKELNKPTLIPYVQTELFS